MKIEERIKYHKCLLVFKCLKNEAPLYLTEKLHFLSEKNPYPIRNAISGNLIVPKPRTELYKKSFVYSGSLLWNEMPCSIRMAPSIYSFKGKVKEHFMNSSQ